MLFKYSRQVNTVIISLCGNLYLVNYKLAKTDCYMPSKAICHHYTFIFYSLKYGSIL